MRVLMACGYDEHPYVRGLCDALRAESVTVDTGLDKFWVKDRDYDIVHLQWPESLFAWRSPLWAEVNILLADVLPKWRRTGKIIATRHNAKRHDIGDVRPCTDYLYDHLYKHVDGVIHLGDYGVEEFKQKHSTQDCHHVIIPHPVFISYKEGIDSITARKLLSISKYKTVILIFGSVRNVKERNLAQKSFFHARISSKLLIAPSFGTPIRPSRRSVVPWMLWEIRHREILWPRRMCVANVRVPDDSVHVYFSAADVVFLPRIDALNSGVLPLAFQYGKVVVGPSIGNIGPVLKATGNPIFDPNSTKSCAAALEESVCLAAQDQGSKNFIYSLKYWSMKSIAQQYKHFYENILAGFK